MVEHTLMVCVCYYCNQVYGEKEPLQNKEITSGECPVCHFLFRIWYRGWNDGHITVSAKDFILEYRKTLAQYKEDPKIEEYFKV